MNLLIDVLEILISPFLSVNPYLLHESKHDNNLRREVSAIVVEMMNRQFYRYVERQMSSIYQMVNVVLVVYGSKNSVYHHSCIDDDNHVTSNNGFDRIEKLNG